MFVLLFSCLLAKDDIPVLPLSWTVRPALAHPCLALVGGRQVKLGVGSILHFHCRTTIPGNGPNPENGGAIPRLFRDLSCQIGELVS